MLDKRQDKRVTLFDGVRCEEIFGLNISLLLINEQNIEQPWLKDSDHQKSVAW